MQLILTQNDIELALIDYANKLITIKDGMAITVELKATRGADGATAIIDISPTAVADKPEPTKPTTSAVVATSKPKAETKPKADPTPRVTPDPVDEAADANANDQASDSQDTPADNGDAADDAGGDSDAGSDDAADAGESQAAEAEAPVADAKPKSLFANLKKPVNS